MIIDFGPGTDVVLHGRKAVLSDAPPKPPSDLPQIRLIREGEFVVCRRCGSGRHAHRTGERVHPFDGPPTLAERIVSWARRLLS